MLWKPGGHRSTGPGYVGGHWIVPGGKDTLATKTHRNDSLKALSNWWNFEKLQAYGKTPTLKCKQLISNKFKIHVDHRKPSAVPVTYSEFSAVHICVSGPLHRLPLALALRVLIAWTCLMSPPSDTTSPNIDRHGEQPIWKPSFRYHVTKHRQAQRTAHMNTQGEDSYLYTKERGLRGNQPFSHLDLGLPASKIRFLLFKLPIYGSLLWQP